jgi:hypothetical protein
MDPEDRINFRARLASPAQGNNCGPAILGKREQRVTRAFYSAARDRPTYLLQLEAESPCDFSVPLTRRMAGKNLLDYRRVVDFPARIPLEDRLDAFGSERQQASDTIGRDALIGHEQNIGCGSVHAPARFAGQTIATANG